MEEHYVRKCTDLIVEGFEMQLFYAKFQRQECWLHDFTVEEAGTLIINFYHFIHVYIPKRGQCCVHNNTWTLYKKDDLTKIQAEHSNILIFLKLNECPQEEM
ncbi:hypothetical protein KAM353_20760 [Aeromonas caviae]|uniref:Uncharacterized protein n=1 Tax=Aeromonas caviae TaxID=648 RepID=A0AA37CXT1_AERCA|nr:hypothetical protein KAM336_24470 [Aeromonas caviae]GJA28222.1 hypothetical protein KAM340_23890 [Aeromonas caviae]GJA63822.1 hypothetical protein KAM351_24330 [Aeromonas caviae]GJA72429.1 hypothetical protein KAM353_20760 [Aeromonas caviae]GJB03118.1 hypothetical protein KAM360_20610 [Aeromonas caviae]